MANGASNSDGPLDDSEKSSSVSDTSTDSALSTPPRTLFAEIFVSHDDLVLVPTIEAVPEMTIQVEEPPTADTSVFVSVIGSEFAAFERAVEADPTVQDATLFSATADHRVYRVRTDASSIPFPSTISELGVRLLDLKSGTDGWVARIQMLSREPLIELRKRCLTSNVQFKVRQLYDGDPDSEMADTRLTGRQRDTVLTAYQSGYYDIPRGISQGELAEKLGVSTSAISQQLRRATGQLIASTFAAEQD